MVKVTGSHSKVQTRREEQSSKTGGISWSLQHQAPRSPLPMLHTPPSSIRTSVLPLPPFLLYPTLAL